MAETPQGSGVETPKDTHGLNLQIPKKYTETPDSNKLDTPRQDVATLKEMQINDLTLKLRQDRQSLSLELEIPLGWTAGRDSTTTHPVMQEALKNIVDRAYVDMVFSVAENEIKDKKPLTYSVQVLENILKKLKDTQTDVSDLEARLSVIKAAIDKKD